MFILYENIPDNVKEFLANTNQTTIKFFNYDFFLDCKSAVILNENKNIIAATILKFYPNDNNPWLSYFVVEPSFRRQRIGSQLLDNLKENFEAIHLECWIENEEAFKFYTNQQFKITERFNNSIYMAWLLNN